MKLPTTIYASSFSYGPYLIRYFIPFIIPYFNRENGDVSSFAQMLDNIFSPLFAVSLDPSSNPPLHYFLGTSHRAELHCVVLHYTALRCTVTYWAAQYCTTAFSTVLYCYILHCTVLHCNVAFCPHSLPSPPPSPLLFSSSPPLSSLLPSPDSHYCGSRQCGR
jgi:AMP deaminase